MAKRGKRRNSPRKRTRRKATPRRRSLSAGALGLAVLAAAGLAALVPSVREGAAQAAGVVSRALNESRAAEMRNARVLAYTARYGISPDLAREIERAAIAEGIDPDLAFRLVQVESSFQEHAVSPAGALGLTQLMPATAEWLQPGITTEQIFDRRTNLRLGFGYLRRLLRVYDGRVEDALHAYNRGPGTVDRIRAAGGDPANGYADRVLRPASGERYRGSGLLPSP